MCINNNLLTQVIEKPMRKNALLHQMLIYKEGLVRDMKVKGSLGGSDN